MTVSVRRLRRSDDAWLESWLASASASVGYPALDASSLRARTSAEPNLRGMIIAQEGRRMGVVVSRLHLPRPHEAIIELLATPAVESRQGFGMEAAAALEPLLRRARIRRVYAPAPSLHGIAVYFWIRLGYRPLLRAEWPCSRPGVGWLARDL